MRLGLSLGYATSAQQLADAVDLAVTADRLGFDCVWVAEAYGSDAPTVLAAIAARTERIGIGSAVLQIPGRTPAMTAMTAATLDALSGGRFRLGLGVSGPQVSEGWHGVPFADPVGRTREYVAVVRRALSRRRVTADGPHYPLPLPDGQGKPLLLSLAPVRPRIPVYLAAIGPRNLELTGEVADGWLGIFFDPETGRRQLDRIADAARRAGRDPAGIDIAVQVPVSLDPDPGVAADRVRPEAALYVGGMGSRTANFYHRQATEMGFGTEADEVQDRFLAGDHTGARAAVPFEFLDATSLLGDDARIGRRLAVYRDRGVGTVNVSLPGTDGAERAAVLERVMTTARAAGVLG
ncbi:LLM class F420-dependent oxidoreductase [Nakamurella endophytica]|uniref:LLM class F420-dependent oxidoreductase n=1 Tax=Nakamurella endophytica TaxID=1748367 RepID=A0A917SSA8_9ACTN|nr:LLM class F420-dependent oxidoreductase [Nakamurella endophytica]GGL93205.1 LLM class F420-dependent oxidoreductase [Nakamurella endophytica]